MAITGVGQAITWRNFTEQRVRPAGEVRDAFTTARSGATFAYRENHTTHEFALTNVVVRVFMSRPESWVVTSRKTADLLQHEQGHYNITALGARDLHQALLALTASSVDEIRQAASDLKDETQASIDAMDILYDDETDHSLIRDAQLRWTGRIRSAIANPSATLESVKPSPSATP